MCTVGISVWLGGGSEGLGPVPALSGKVAISPQLERCSMSKAARKARVVGSAIGAR
jgi:hypothetical protein